MVGKRLAIKLKNQYSEKIASQLILEKEMEKINPLKTKNKEAKKTETLKLNSAAGNIHR